MAERLTRINARLPYAALFIAGSLSASAAWAAPGTVSLETLLDVALARNPEVKISEASAEQAEARWDGARWKYIPKLSGSVGYFTQDQGQVSAVNTNPGIPNFAVGGQSGVTAKVGVSLNVFNGFQDRHREVQRRREYEKSVADVSATRLSQWEKIVASAFTILRLQSDEQNLEEKIAVEKERARDLAKKVEAQLARASDLLSVQASLISSESDLQNTRSELANEWRTLRSLSGAELPYERILPPESALTPLGEIRHPDALPDLKSAQSDLAAAQLSAKASGGALLPSLDIGFNRYVMRPEILRDSHWDFQATLTIPLPLDGEKRASWREAEAAALQKEATLLKKQQDKAAELGRLVAGYQADLARLERLSAGVAIQARLADALKQDYQHGLASITDYLSAVSGLLQKKQERDHLQLQEWQRAYQIRNYQRLSGESL